MNKEREICVDVTENAMMAIGHKQALVRVHIPQLRAVTVIRYRES